MIIICSLIACNDIDNTSNSTSSNSGQNEFINTDEESSSTCLHISTRFETVSVLSCTTDKLIHEICNICEETVTTEFQSKLGHLEETIYAESPTCSLNGLTEGKKCRVCNEILVVQQVIPSTGHKLGNWEFDTHPTCTTNGEKIQKCTICKEIINHEFLKATGHSEGKWVEDTIVSCTQDGIEHQICDVCGNTIKTNIIKTEGHTLGEWKTTTNYNCSTDGLEQRFCNNCNYFEERPIPASHKYSSSVSHKNCISNAIATYICDVCSDTYSAEVSPITALIIKTKSNMYYEWYTNVTYSIHSSGGYGKHTYKYEVFDSYNLKEIETDFSNTNTIEFGIEQLGNWHIKGAVLKVTIKDEANNTVSYSVLVDDDSVLENTILNENLHSFEPIDSNTYINTYGFGQYKCKLCNEIAYKDSDGKELEKAELVLSNDEKTILSCSNEQTAELLIIPNTVTSFDDESLFVYSKIKCVFLNSNSVEFSLQGCDIKTLYIPKESSYSVLSFSSCEELDTVIFENGATNIYCFANNSKIKYIVLPNSVERIAGNFSGCEELSTIFYKGTSEQWETIEFSESGTSYVTNALCYFYSEEKPTVDGYFWHYIEGKPVIWNE